MAKTNTVLIKLVSSADTGFYCVTAEGSLLDLGFLEDDVLPGDGIVLLQLELLGLGPRILFRHVIEARVSAADELDENGIRFGHGGIPPA